VLAGPQPAHETVVDAAEQFLLFVRDADDGELREAMEVVDNAWLFELVDLIEDDDRTRAVVLLEAVDEFVVGRRLTVNVDGCTEIVEDLVECSEAGIVPPAVHVGGLDVEDFLTKAFGDELRDTGLARPAGPGDDGGVGGFAVRDGFEDAGEMVNLGVTMLDFARDESSPENASIADHLLLTDLFLV